MALYDVEGRGTIWASSPEEAFTLAHGKPSDGIKLEPAGQHTWRVDANGRQVKVTVRTDA